MKEKSQFYIFASIILLSYVFIVLANKSSIRLSEFDDYNTLLDNYVYEGNNIINNAIYSNKNISNELNKYTENFFSFVQLKNMDIKLVSMYSRNNKIYAINYLNDPVIISGIEILPDQEKVINFQNDIELVYLNKVYYYEFSNPMETEFKVLFVKEK